MSIQLACDWKSHVPDWKQRSLLLLPFCFLSSHIASWRWMSHITEQGMIWWALMDEIKLKWIAGCISKYACRVWWSEAAPVLIKGLRELSLCFCFVTSLSSCCMFMFMFFISVFFFFERWTVTESRKKLLRFSRRSKCVGKTRYRLWDAVLLSVSFFPYNTQFH